MENSLSTRRTLFLILGGAIVLAVTIIAVMTRLVGNADQSLALARAQHEESALHAKLQREVQHMALEAAEVLMGLPEVEELEKYKAASRAVLRELDRRHAELDAKVDRPDEERDREALGKLAEAFDAFVKRVEELRKLPPSAAGFKEADTQLGALLAAIDSGVTNENEDFERDVAEYREELGTWARIVDVGLIVVIALVMAPIYWMALRIRKGYLAQARTAKRFQASSAELLAVAKQTEANASDEAAAVDETRRTMQALLGSAAEIADAAGKVSESAEHSVGASKIIGDRILNLTIQSQKIRKIAESIKSIADKSDILALNAALEGAKAGETGRGFVLLGNEMRRLAESIGTASSQVGDLAQEISEFSRGAVLSTEEGQKLAAETAAVARRITLITGQQRTATEQVTKSMDEVHQYTQQALAGAQQARATAGDLARTAAELEDLVVSKPLPPAVERT